MSQGPTSRQQFSTCGPTVLSRCSLRAHGAPPHQGRTAGLARGLWTLTLHPAIGGAEAGSFRGEGRAARGAPSSPARGRPRASPPRAGTSLPRPPRRFLVPALHAGKPCSVSGVPRRNVRGGGGVERGPPPPPFLC